MNLKDLREEITAKRDLLEKVFKEARAEKEDGTSFYDFTRVKSINVGDVADEDKPLAVAEKVSDLQRQLDELIEKERKLSAAENALESFKQRESQRTTNFIHMAPQHELYDDVRPELAVKELAKTLVERCRNDSSSTIRVEKAEVGYFEMKDMSTTAGFPPARAPRSQVVEIPLRPPQILDIIPRAQTGFFEYTWVEQTVRDQAAAEVPEGGLKPPARYEYVEKSTPIREIAVSLAVTDQQLEDVPAVESIIKRLLVEDMRERLDRQILVGDGIAPNLQGILNTPGLLTVARGTDSQFDAIHKAITQVRVGPALEEPTHVILNPADFENLRLAQTQSGAYVMGPPSDAGVQRLWGLPVLLNSALSQGTALVGSFAMRNIVLIERRGIKIERGFVNTQFQENKQTIRASLRAGLAVTRPAAFATVTGL